MKTSKIILALFIGQILCLGVAQTIFCQTETLDIVQYTPPKGWAKTPKEGAITYSDINKTSGGFCIITVYASTPSAGTPQKDFANEWAELVVKPFKAEANPKTENQTDDGWTSTAGASQIEMDGTKSLVFLTVLSGYGKTASVFSILSDQSYLTQLDAFMAGITMDKSKPAANPKPGIQNKNPGGETIQSSNAPGRFGHVIFKAPEGWKQTNYTNAVSLSPSSIPAGYNLELRIMESKPFSGSLQQAFAKSWTDALQQLESVSTYPNEVSVEKTSFQGWEYIRGQGIVNNKNEDNYRLNLFVVKLNNRIERMFAVSQLIPLTYGERLNAFQFGGYSEVVDDFMYSVKFDDWKDRDNSTANLSGGGIVGMYAGLKLGNGDLTNGGGLNGTYALFFSNGQVYFRDKLPTAGFDGINTQAAADQNIRNWGTYTLQNGKGELKLSYGSVPLTVNGSSLILITQNTPHKYVKIPSIDGVVFNGTYYFEGDYGAKGTPSITFTLDGKFIDNGALDILYHQSTTSADIAKEHGSGTYQAKNHTLIFKYSDGRKIQIAFSGLNYDRRNQSPPSLELSFNNDTLLKK
ncbi:MAG: hypothetical protein QOH96_206 [Blastocatellia bacterium]|jgi:hypothetical protein|nr:hypothetical protein [Blastocatellia bacterium]